MEAEIITIGTEILLGEIVDTNTRTLARRLRDLGIDIFLTTTVGDNAKRIAEAIRSSASRADFVITTGGLGPTIDDATREGIAAAMNRDLYFEDELWKQIQDRFAQFGRTPSDNNRRQAFIPSGAIAIENPVGTAPSFILETKHCVVIALPGVPSEMTYLLEHDVVPYLKSKLGSFDIIKTRLVRTAGIGESILDERIQDLEQLSNPTVGLSAHPGRVDIRITAKARSAQQAEEMLWKVQATLEQRLGRHIYGIDNETLEESVLDLLREKNLTLATLEVGTEGLLSSNLGHISETLLHTQEKLLSELGDSIDSAVTQIMSVSGATTGLGLILLQDQEQGSTLEILIKGQNIEKRLDETYPAVFVNMKSRAVSFALDLLRRVLLEV